MGFKIFIIFTFLISISFIVSGQTKKDFDEYINYPRLNSISRNFDLSGISDNNFKKEFDRHSLFFNESMKHSWDSSVNLSRTLFQKPELDFSRMPLEFLAGNGLGVASGVIGGLLYLTISGKISYGMLPEVDVAMALTLTIFHTAGSIAGVYFTGGNNEKIEYNIGWTIIGGLIGTGAELLCLYFESKSDNKSNTALFLLTTTLPTIGSMVGLHTSMEYKNPGSKINSLLNFDSGKMKLKMPAINSKRLPYFWNKQNNSKFRSHFYYISVSLLSYNF